MNGNQHPELQARGLRLRYGKNEVLHGIDLTLRPGCIYGLVGRNGAGKTTLLSCLTGQLAVSEGAVTCGGQPVWENPAALANLCFSREIGTTLGGGPNNMKVRDYLEAAALFLPHWDKEYAARLVARFGLDERKKICKLSKGMLSMVTIVIALASRAPITILDEPVAGLDVVAREDFYKLLLEDYAETGRTFVISTHIIEEAASVFEEVILLDEGRILEMGETDELVGQFAAVTGAAEAVDAVCAGHRVLTCERLGRQKQCVVRLPGGPGALRAGGEVDVEPLTLQKVFVTLCGHEEKGGGAA